jgi:hypothetical protein
MKTRLFNPRTMLRGRLSTLRPLGLLALIIGFIKAEVAVHSETYNPAKGLQSTSFMLVGIVCILISGQVRR